MSASKVEINDELTEHRRIYPSVCAGMLIFWTVLISGLWLLLKYLLIEDPILSEGQLRMFFGNNLFEYSGTLGIALASLTLLAVLGFYLFAGRRAFKKNLHQRHSFIHRAIFNRLAQWFLLITVFFLALVTLLNITMLGLGFDPTCETIVAIEKVECDIATRFLNFLDSIQGFIGAIIVFTLFGATGLLGALALIFSSLLQGIWSTTASGVGVVRDVIVFAIRDKCALRWDLKARQQNYPDRTAIDERFYRTLNYTLDVFPADHVTVISHSQGTVIATQMLADPRVQKLIGGRSLTLVTMGCPVTHIYQRYFPEMFTVDPQKLGAAWFNIFRQDDFVGTRIDGNLIPADQNIDVEPGGHTGYFTDYQVWKELTGDKIGFHLFNPKRH